MQSSFVDVNTSAEELNYDCNHNMMLAKSLMKNLPNSQDRKRVVRWLQKLATPTTDLEEMGLRNIFVYYLVVSLQESKLTPPFTRDPPTGPLITLRCLLADKSSESNVPGEDPIDQDTRKKSGNNRESTPTFDQAKPFLYQQSPDGGAFLAAQPVPRCGAFCYMAVVARSANS